MKIKIQKKRITVTHNILVLDDGFEFSDVYELYELLDALGESDGFMTRILIEYPPWGKKLEELNVAVKSNRGSYYRGKKFDSFRKEVTKLLGQLETR
jgi:hypothetical protein